MHALHMIVQKSTHTDIIMHAWYGMEHGSSYKPTPTLEVWRLLWDLEQSLGEHG